MAEIRKLPLLPLRGMMVFPYMIINLDVGRDRSVAALDEAMVQDRRIMLTAQRNPEVDAPKMEELYEVGTIAEVRQLLKLPGGTIRVLVEGIHRARIVEYTNLEKYVEVGIEEYTDEIDTSVDMEAITKAVVHEFEKWVKLSKKIPPETLISVAIIEDTGRLGDLIASHLNLKLEEKQELLELIDVKARMEKLYALLIREMEILEIERKISVRVRRQMEKIQKEYYLREQIKAIQKELGDKDDKTEEIEEYKKRLTTGNYPGNVRKCIEKEIRRMENMSNMSAETGVIRTYIDWMLNMPWEIMTEDTIDIPSAEKTLNKEHYGLDKVKERILEYLAVHKLSKDQRAPILCLVGPPGVGKTSLAGSVAHAIGRKFIRASLGGIRDEAEIRGHRRTYVGAMPGRILEGIRDAGTKNPVFLLDEIDKIAMDYKGDPSAALLEVLDPAQNSTFSDHYIELPFDLSHVLWIVTANNLGNIPRALRDRMEIISLSSYTEIEKFEIGKRYLVDKQRRENGLKPRELQIAADVLPKIIAEYTRESGVRELERMIGHICRKAARKIVEGKKKSVHVTIKNLITFLGKPKFTHTKAEQQSQIGVCTGMAWTEVGGDILPTEAAVVKGKGNLILTGQLGDVMQESAKAGLSYIRSRLDEFHLSDDFYEKQDIHIHLPEGAIPKDGPSAGITMATAMISALTHRKVRSDIAMTGEITLRGRVLPIGGLKEKVLAAYREGIRTIILPSENERDIDEIPESVREKLKFVPVASMDEVLKHALES
jgi:ATP-dependent Lon protease